MSARVIASVDLDDEITMQLQVEFAGGGLFVSCGQWHVPVDKVHPDGALWVEANLAAENQAPALVTLDFFADFAKARGAG